jgi:ABC-type transport system involved in multi-copper enzyme maturation permease subunit
MKPLAILKDSVREAMDAKVFYVMIGLSVLAILVVASISFTPASPREAMQTWLKQLDEDPTKSGFARADFQGGGFGAYTIKEVEPLDGGDPAAARRYRVVIIAPLDNIFHGGKLKFEAHDHDEKDDDVKKQRQESREQELPRQEKLLQERFANFGGLRAVEVTAIEHVPNDPALPAKATFELTVERTDAAAQLWPYEPTVAFGLIPLTDLKFPLGMEIYVIQQFLFLGVDVPVCTMVSGKWVAILVSLVITAFFVPNMLRKGTIDLLLVKPLHRSTLLIYKYLGGLSFMFLNTCFAVGGIWLMIGLRTGIWLPHTLLIIPLLTFFFAILYSVSVLFGVLTRSTIVAILMSVGAWFLFWLVGVGYNLTKTLAQMPGIQKSISEGWWVPVVNVIHAVLPRTTDIDVLGQEVLTTGLLTPQQLGGRPTEILDINWVESIGVSLAFIGVMLGLACWRFSRKDY